MRSFFSLLKAAIYKHLVRPVLESVAPIEEVAWGTAIGLFVGLTPTVGIQMYVVFLLWILCKYVFGFRFDLVVGTAMVWITNPITFIFIYYMFLKTGVFFFSLIGSGGSVVDYAIFKATLESIVNNPDYGLIDVLVQASHYLFFELGLPMLVGSLFYAIPFPIISYFLVYRLLLNYRVKKANEMGLTYDEWKAQFQKRKE